ncbi:MAG: HEAT repeat domain-containing protein, partial [Bacteroidota bacterium]
MAGDAAMGVRREALLALVAHQWPGANEAIESGLLDGHASVREVARFFATQRASGDRDLAPLYRAALAEARNTAAIRAALGGLSETGSHDDATLVAPFLGDSRSSIRAAALRTIARIAPADSPEAFRAALRDPSRRVVRTAATGLASGAIPGIDVAQTLVEAFSSSRMTSTRLALLPAVSRMPPWVALPHLLHASSRPETRAIALGHLTRWAHLQVFTHPTPEQRAAIESAWPIASVAGLPDLITREIRARLDRDA